MVDAVKVEAQGPGGLPSADSNLENLGYVPELSRNRSTWQVMFMSFIMASVPYTISTTMSYTMTGGGPSNMIWGWVTICLFMLCLGASLAEITSVFPTAGGVYYQTFALSPPWCRRVMAWICGWCYFAGQVTITLSVNFGTTLFFIEALNLFKYADGTGFTENFEAWHTYLIFLGITLFTHILPSIGNKWLTYVEACLLCAIVPSEVVANFNTVVCRLLGYRRYYRYHRYHPCCRRSRKTSWSLGFRWLRTALGLARWLVFLYRFASMRLQFVGYWNGHIVSFTLFCFVFFWGKEGGDR